VCALVVLCVGGATAGAQSVLVAPRIEDHDGRRVPFTVGFKLESAVGQGTFIADEYARNSQVGWGASIAPGYRPTDELLLSAYAKVTQELTDSDVDSQRQQMQLLDVNVRSDYLLGTIPVIDVNAATGLWLYLPTSRVSQFETLVLGAAARLVLGRRFGEHFSVDYLGMFRKNFHEYEGPVLNATAGSPPPILVRRGSPQDLGGSLVAAGTNNVSFFFYNVAQFAWMPAKELSFAIAYGLTNAFTYAGHPKDELSSPYAEDGIGQRDSTVGVIEALYQLDKRFTFAAGIQTLSVPKSDDNQSFRFPFYDFEGAAANATTFYIDVTVTEAIGD
jgi:hypothetical protein